MERLVVVATVTYVTVAIAGTGAVVIGLFTFITKIQSSLTGL